VGYLSAAAFATATDRTTALVWHLTANHYPPLPAALVATCEAAIEAVLEGEPDRPIDWPDVGIQLRARPYGPATDTPTAGRIVEACHLEAFIDTAETN
jgi:hypothetical protein